MSSDSKTSFSTINPATGKKIADYKYLSKSELNQSIEKCNTAFLSWRDQTLKERSKIIKGIGVALRKNEAKLSALMTEEMGKLLEQSSQEVELCAGICDYSAKQAPKLFKPERRKLENGNRGLITYSPLGVIYGIQPWNYPTYQVVRFAIASLIAGNAVLLKHASNVTGTAKLLEEIFKEGGLPDDLFKVLIIDHKQSDKVIKSEHVRGVTFTGSAEAGKEIGKKAGKALKKSVLELGSNDAYVVLGDANIKNAVEKCVMGRVYNNGETCIAAKRFIVVDKVYDEFKEAFVEAMENLKIGDPTSSEVDLGPIAREDLRAQIHGQVEKSVKKGAEILCGGKIPKGEGFYYPSTVLGSVEPGQPAYDDEIFGPVASLIRAKDEQDAMRIANDSRFGLGGGIFSKNKRKAIKLAQNQFNTGMIFINTFGLATPSMPFGGVKDSGFGREHGGFGMKEFVNVKSVVIG